MASAICSSPMTRQARRLFLLVGILAARSSASLTAAGQSTPLRSYRAELFEPGVVSTRDYERDGTFSPDGQTFYFTKRTIWPYFSAICVSRFRRGRWTEPDVAPFSGQYPDATPFISADGSRLYFASRRPAERAQNGYNIWMATRVKDSWSTPELLPQPINGRGSVISPVETRNGSLYFIRTDDARLYVSERRGAGWAEPVPIVDSAAQGTAVTSVYVDPDERFMIVAIVGRADAMSTAEGIYARADLYVRERRGSAWSASRHLPPPINSAAEEGSPFLSPDRRFLYFTSERGPLTEHGTRYDAAALEHVLHSPGNGLGDIYRIDFRATGIAP